MTAGRRQLEDQLEDLTPSLVASLRSGDSLAGRLLNRLYRERMIRFCWGYLGSVEESEDAVQDIFCKVLAANGVPDKFRPWLYKIARNHCLNLRRAKGRRLDNHALPPSSALDAGARGNLAGMIDDERRQRLSHLVEALPAIHREVLKLRYTEDLSRAEIAEVLGIPESVVKSRLFEGIKKLREHSSLVEES
jgi:RNA polymerase sigma-70 factor (ECF subfamily)